MEKGIFSILENVEWGKNAPPLLTGTDRCVHLAHMSRKTISIDSDAYDILVKAKETPRMSFSDAIRRVKEMPRVRTFADLIKYEDELFPMRKTRSHARKAAVAR